MASRFGATSSICKPLGRVLPRAKPCTSRPEVESFGVQLTGLFANWFGDLWRILQAAHEYLAEREGNARQGIPRRVGLLAALQPRQGRLVNACAFGQVGQG